MLALVAILAIASSPVLLEGEGVITSSVGEIACTPKACHDYRLSALEWRKTAKKRDKSLKSCQEQYAAELRDHAEDIATLTSSSAAVVVPVVDTSPADASIPSWVPWVVSGAIVLGIGIGALATIEIADATRGDP